MSPNAELVYQYIQEHPYTSFAELERLFESNGLVQKNDNVVIFPVEGYENLVIWITENITLAEAYTEACSGKILMQTTQPLTYLADGMIMNLPLGRKLRNYKTRHWHPVTFRMPTEQEIRELTTKQNES